MAALLLVTGHSVILANAIEGILSKALKHDNQANMMDVTKEVEYLDDKLKELCTRLGRHVEERKLCLHTRLVLFRQLTFIESDMRDCLPESIDLGMKYKRIENALKPSERYAELGEFVNHLRGLRAAFEPQLDHFNQRLLEVDHEIAESETMERGKERKIEIWKILFECRRAADRLENVMKQQPPPPVEQEGPSKEAETENTRELRPRNKRRRV